MLHHATRKPNKVERFLLLSAIALVAVLDLFFTGYVVDDGLPDEAAVQVRAPVSTIDPVIADVVLQAPSTTVSAVDEIGLRPVKAPARLTTGRRANAPSNVSTSRTREIVRRPSDRACRTVSYPFVNATYFVRVIDDTACFPSVRDKFKNERLTARLDRSRRPDWQ